MTSKAIRNSTIATPITAAARMATRLRGARIAHGDWSAPGRPSANARNWAVLADGSGSGLPMAGTVAALTWSSPGLLRIRGEFASHGGRPAGVPDHPVVLPGGRM